MKKQSILLITALITSIHLLSQNLNKNKCTKEIELTFITKKEADKAIKNNSDIGSNVLSNKYVNIVIDDNGFFYLDENLTDEYSLLELIKNNTTLSKKIDVVIGIYNEVKFKKLTDFLCWLDRLHLYSSYRVDKIFIYHFDYL